MRRVAMVVFTLVTGVAMAVAVWTLLTQFLDSVLTDDKPGAMTWPALSSDVTLWLLVGGFMVGAVLGRILDWVGIYNGLGMNSPEPVVTSTGATVGALVAASGFRAMPGSAIVWGVGAVLALITIRTTWRFIRDMRGDQARSAYRARLRAEGTHVRADVVDVDFLQTWIGSEPLFRVTARFDTPAGPVTATDRVLTSPAAAPIVDGTILVWYDPGGDPTDVVMKIDETSPRDPEAVATYTATGSWS